MASLETVAIFMEELTIKEKDQETSKIHNTTKKATLQIG